MESSIPADPLPQARPEMEALMELMKEEQARGNTDAAVRQRC